MIMNSTESAERYVSGRMDEVEERHFEEAMLEAPDVAADVDVRHRIKLGLRELEERGELEALIQRPARRFSQLRYAVAACALLALGAAIAYWQVEGGARVAMAGSLAALRGGGSQPVAASYILASTRSRPEETVVSAEPGAGAIRLRIVLDSGIAQSFVASLAQVSGSGESVVAMSVPLDSAADGLVEVFLDPRALESGRYVLRLAPGASDGGVAEEFAFSLNLKR
jgi:hypothetical protein